MSARTEHKMVGAGRRTGRSSCFAPRPDVGGTVFGVCTADGFRRGSMWPDV